ncbi:truncated IS6110 transposase [Mycobacterium tuberculosis CAS/NITR204]|uniref:Truncated IS6110 transposase n=1 Tax=Mycobacterium tuberculosis CAS/NITR204 TaxID=1310114 RepID=R4MDZ3_MYCTX|nr:truncated IS6110 transposase [Mycobacterium tuberculosis CAS/NITR204]
MSSWPPRAGSTGSTIAASTSTAATSRRSNSRLPTTLNARDQPPAEVSDQRVSGLTGAVQERGSLVGHTSTRLASSVAPPSCQCRMWWACKPRVAPQPGTTHVRSRCSSARRNRRLI